MEEIKIKEKFSFFVRNASNRFKTVFAFFSVPQAVIDIYYY